MLEKVQSQQLDQTCSIWNPQPPRLLSEGGRMIDEDFDLNEYLEELLEKHKPKEPGPGPGEYWG